MGQPGYPRLQLHRQVGDSLTTTAKTKAGVAEFAGRASGRTQGAMGNGEDASTTTLTIECVAYKEDV